jgi:hypothetical protein
MPTVIIPIRYTIIITKSVVPTPVPASAIKFVVTIYFALSSKKTQKYYYPNYLS